MNANRFKYKEITDIILTLDPAHEAQLINYLKATNIEVGLLLNFGRKPEFKRFVYDNKRKNISDDQRRSAAE
ncbi:MAG TPA: GxxExxY protein [Proteobacteria bacterium]|nr:GxxExxY protein [Pseudomonadota bacterium]